MNYRHSFHAGNNADVVKHCLLIALVQALQLKDSALTFIDTHAGCGIYDLQGEEATRTGEATGGVLRALAHQGFVPVQHEGDACAQALSNASIGGLVMTKSTVVGLPEGLREGAEFGCVPSSNFIVRVSLPPHPPLSPRLTHWLMFYLARPSPHTQHFYFTPHTRHAAAPHDCQGALCCRCPWHQGGG